MPRWPRVSAAGACRDIQRRATRRRGPTRCWTFKTLYSAELLGLPRREWARWSGDCAEQSRVSRDCRSRDAAHGHRARYARDADARLCAQRGRNADRSSRCMRWSQGMLQTWGRPAEFAGVKLPAYASSATGRCNRRRRRHTQQPVRGATARMEQACRRTAQSWSDTALDCGRLVSRAGQRSEPAQHCGCGASGEEHAGLARHMCRGER